VLTKQLDLFSSRLPSKPYCSDDLAGGLRIRNRDHALRHKHIQHNPPPLIAWLVYDVDRPGSADEWIHAMLPPPAWVAVNPANGHSHIAYGLEAPVARTDAARAAPLRLAAAIEAAYRDALGADRGYAGLITKNPLSDAWRVWTPESANKGIYDLGELAEYVTLPKRLPKRDLNVGLGRNVALFDGLRKWAYRAIRDFWKPGGADAWHTAVLEKAESLNEFIEPLPLSEIKATAKSVARWTWKHTTPNGFRSYVERTHTPEAQAVRGMKSGEVRRDASAESRARSLEMRARGMTQAAIAAEIGVSQASVSLWLRSNY